MKMTWKGVILFAIIAGVYTGLIMLPPQLKETSLQDIGINLEWWVIFAMIIVVNCKKNWQAMLKTFVFFLISQPIIYGIQILLGDLTLDMACYYYRMTWLPWTIAVLPMAFIAFYSKKDNILGVIILALANTIQLVEGIIYFLKAAGDFPHHIISAIICILSIFAMTFGIQKSKKHRIWAILLPIIFTVVIGIFALLTGRMNY